MAGKIKGKPRGDILEAKGRKGFNKRSKTIGNKCY